MAVEPRDLSPDEVIEKLRHVDLFQGLPDDELRGVSEVVNGLTAQDGDVLFEEGEPGDCFYVVSKGAVEISKSIQGDGSEKLAVRRAGEAFGEMALLNDASRSATAKALEESLLLTLSRDDFETLVGGDSLSMRMLQVLSKALRALGVRFANLERGVPTTVAESDGGEDANRALQRSIIPRSAPTADGFDIAAGTMLEDSGAGRTAWETVRLSGGGVGLMAMTVHGDGLPPAHQLALARAFLNEYARTGQGAESLLARVNDGLAHNETPGVDQTVAAGLLVPGDGSVVWSGAGGVQGAVIRREGTLDEFPSHGPPLGMLEGFQYGTQEYQIGTGDMVIVLSTASTGLFRGAADLVSTLQQKPTGEVVATVHKAIRKLQGDNAEEITVLFMRKH